MTIYFDTETTGLVPGRILQLSYVLDYKDKVIGKNFFFYVDYVPEEAVKVHGFTVEKLAVLSGGKTFSDYSEEIYKDFITADLIVAHNVKFDLSFLQAEFCYLDEIFKYNASLDTMKYFTPVTCLPRRSGGYKYPKLSEVGEHLEIYPYDVTKKCAELFNTYNVSFHDARYDTALMYIAVKLQAEKDEQLYNLINE